MPTSSNSGKICIAEELQNLSEQFSIQHVLDIGAGEGTYVKKFRNKLKTATWSAVEVWPEYVKKFQLEEIYDSVIVADARLVDYSSFRYADVVFAGDVLEHMTKDEAIQLVDAVLANHKLMIVSIPIIYMPQGEFEGNPYERHVKDDWTDTEVKSTFGNRIVRSVVDCEIGIYIFSRDQQVIDFYQSLRRNDSFRLHEEKVFSQNGEDGIIEHIFATISTTNKVAVEIGVAAGGSGLEANTRLLASNGWKCFWIDCEEIEHCPESVVFTQKFLNKGNIKETFDQLGVPTEFDLLSLDVDGNDYHFREALSTYRPRVCVLEYNGSFLSGEEYVMPYDDNYRWQLWETNFGASLMSFYKQAQQLGYDLVYCESRGVNAFFVRKDINPWPKYEPKDVWVKLWWAQ